MSCPFEDEIYLLEDHKLPFARHVVVEAHLGTCGSCAEKEAALHAAMEILASGDERPLGVVEPTLAGLAPRRRRRSYVPAGLAVAAVVAIVAWLPPSLSPPPPPPPKVSPESIAGLPPPEKRDGPPLIELVRKHDPGAAARAVIRDGAAGSAALARLLASGEVELVDRALAVAARAPSPWLAPEVTRLLKEKRFAVRAARLLAGIGSARAVPALERVLDGPAGVEAREALVAIGGSAAANALARRLDEPGVLDALVRTDPERGARELVARVDTAQAHRVLARRREALLPELRRLARRGSPGAVLALGRVRDEHSLPLLISLAGRPSTAEAATRSLLALGTKPALRAAFRAACRGAVLDPTPAMEAFLLERLREGPFVEQRTALSLLRRCGGAATVSALAEAHVPRGLVRETIRTLGAIGDASAVPLLGRHASQFAPDVARALARIHHESSARRLVEMVVRKKSEREAGRALASMPAAVVVPVLLEHFESRHIRRVLVRIAGTDLGSSLTPWKRWWKSQP